MWKLINVVIETTDGNQKWFSHKHDEENTTATRQQKKKPTLRKVASVLVKEIVIFVTLDANATSVFSGPDCWYEDDHGNRSIKVKSFETNCFSVQRSSIYWHVCGQ